MPVLLATCADLPEGDEDAALLLDALTARGLDPRWAVWSDPDVDWAAGPTVIRSTWDYTADRPRFLDWVRRVPKLFNPAPVVEWNTDKVYLADLAAAGVPVVPTTVVRPGQDVPAYDAEIVVKPSVGAGSRGVGRFTPDRLDEARRHAAGLHEAGRTVLVQPYLGAVDDEGEAALIYFDGRFSHAITKGAMIPAGMAHAMDAEALFVQERIDPRDAGPAEREVGEQVLQFVRDRFGGDQLYTRVDLLPGPAGPVLVELELVEPSLFLQQSAGGAAADRLAAAVEARA